MATLALRPLKTTGGTTWALVAGLGALLAAAGAAALVMEHEGHVASGMNNQVVWGLPHVFAVFLIVAASGALNVASVASVFGRTAYKPLAPLSALLAIALLAGGLAVLLLDLGRPDRLIVAMTHYNFRSVFAWNVFLYTGFFAIVAAYLWTMLDRPMNRLSPKVGLAAFTWRLLLTTGTGSIFGFLVARPGYDSALLAPTFIALSLSYGTAIFLLVLLAATRGRADADATVVRLARLLGIFVVAALYFVAVFHASGLYVERRVAFERFILLDGGVHTALFWIGQVGLGSLLPLAMLFAAKPSRVMVGVASALVVLGGLAQMWVTIVATQAFPMPLFPGREVRSSFGDGVVASYAPAWPELALGLGGVALAVAIVVAAMRVLPLMPEKLPEGDA